MPEDMWASQATAVHNFTITYATEAVKHVPLKTSTTRILEVGCGTGTFVFPFFEQLDASKHTVDFLATDFSPGMIEGLKSGATKKGLEGKFKSAVMDAQDLKEVENGSMDVVVSLFTLFLVPDPPKAAKEFARALSPGGQVVLTFWKENSASATLRPLLSSLGQDPSQVDKLDAMAYGHANNPEKLNSLLLTAGFDDIQVTEVTNTLSWEEIRPLIPVLLRNPVLGAVFKDGTDEALVQEKYTEVINQISKEAPNAVNRAIIVTAKKT